MRIKPRFFIGGALIIAAIAYLIVTGIRNSAEYYLTVNEVKARQAELGSQPLRIAGRVKPGTAHWEPATLTLAFTIMQIPGSDGNQAGVKPVSVDAAPEFNVVAVGQPKPDMFADNRDVIVEGRLAS